MDKRDIFEWDRCSMIRNGRRWYPVMGECHFSRIPRERWKETVLKMKALGVDILSTYVIWIHHEEIEDCWDFEGRRDLRAFLLLCRELDMYVWLRPGPWAHSETRNGGFPDWLLRKVPGARTNDEAYFDEVRKYYSRVYREAEGLFHKDGGPILGLQIDNEYGHCGGLHGEEGEKHMLRLHRMAEEIGFAVPYVSATGWGGAIIADMIPVMGAYCDAPWDPSIEKLGPNPNYLFSPERDDKKIGCDHEIGCGLSFDQEQYPYLTGELGGGLQVTKHRRPVASAEDTFAMSLCKVGSGANLLGYYMYAGGTNPHGKLTTYQETKAVGDLNDLPEYSYDFNAPIREFGQVSETALELKSLAYFVHDFGEDFAEMKSEFGEDTVIYATDLSSLRKVVRKKGDSGYLFLNNYERGFEMAAHPGAVLSADTENGKVFFDETDIEDGDSFFWPFGMPLPGNAVLSHVNAQPLCLLKNKGRLYYLFFGKKEPVFHVEGETSAELRFIPREEALHSWKFTLSGEDYLVTSEAAVIQEDGRLWLLGKPAEGEKLTASFYPSLPDISDNMETTGISVTEKQSSVNSRYSAEAKLISGDREYADYEVTVRYGTDRIHELFLRFGYEAESLEVFINDVKETDHFYTGQRFELALKQYGYPEKLRIRLHRLYKDTPVYIEKWPEGDRDSWCAVRSLEVSPEVKIPITK